MKKCLSLFLAGVMMLSCLMLAPAKTAAAPAEQRLNLHTLYAYSYPAPKNVTGDETGLLLTDGNEQAFAEITVQNETKEVKDSAGKLRQQNLFQKGTVPHFFIQNDFGFLADVTGVKACFGTQNGSVLPDHADLFVTDDGYNYVRYPAQTLTKNGGSFEIRLTESVKAKGVKLMVYTKDQSKIAVSELSVFGLPNANERLLLSQGAPYFWDGGPVAGYSEDPEGTLLTDGKIARGADAAEMVGRNIFRNGADFVSQSACSRLEVDLGGVKHISEVTLAAHGTEFPAYVNVKYSADGKTFHDLGQSFPLGQFGSGSSLLTHYAVYRNHTVEARYLSISLVGKKAVLSELSVYGSKQKMAEPDYGFTARQQTTPHTNIAPQGKVKVGWQRDGRLNDESYVNYRTLSSYQNTHSVVLEFPEGKNIDGVLLYFLKDGSHKQPASVKTFVSENGSSYQKIQAPMSVYASENRATYRQLFSRKNIRKIKFELQTDGADIGLMEVCAYSGQPHLPIYRGGFFQVNCLDYQFEHAAIKNSEQMWYMQLKGMKELGMDEVVLIASANFANKRTVVPSPGLLAKKYKMAEGLGCADPYQAIFEAAEKLGMRVYVGTVITHGSKEAIEAHGGMAHVQEVLADDRILIADLQKLYGKYASFAGYYFPNETCDKWLNEKGGPELYRTLYQTQSDQIRQLAPDKKIIIAPAIWRAGNDPVQNGNLLYNLIKPASGSRPIVDIVAPQDCLGRPTPTEATEAIYNSMEQYAEEWAKASRRAGCSFWMDAEVLEATYLPKSYANDLHGLEMEAKLTNCIVNFDIPHYFAEISLGRLSSWKRFDMGATMSAYAKRYALEYAVLDGVGRTDAPLKPHTMEKASYAMPLSVQKWKNFHFTDDMDAGFAKLADRSANTQAEQNPDLNTGLYGKSGGSVQDTAWFVWNVGPNIDRIRLRVQCLAGFGKPEEVSIQVSSNGSQWTDLSEQCTVMAVDDRVYGPGEPVTWQYCDLICDSIPAGSRYVKVTLLPYKTAGAPIWSLELDRLDVEYRGESSISMEKTPDQLIYFTGDLLTPAGGLLNLSYESGETKTVPLSEAVITGFDNSKTGKQNLTVLYQNKVTSFDVLVVPKSAVAMDAATEVFYDSVKRAFTDSPEGCTLLLLQDAREANLMLNGRRRLDLNGCRLSAQYLVVFKGSAVFNSREAGFLRLPQGNLVVPSDNEQLPIWNGKDGYLLKSLNLSEKQHLDLTYHGGEGMQLLFKPVFGTRAFETDLLADGSRDNDIQIQVELNWDAVAGNKVTQKFIYVDSLVQWVYGQPNRGFSLSVGKISHLSNLHIFIVVESDCGVCIRQEVNRPLS